jgi:RNA polymerase sigma factor (sigma-70 family)
MDTDSFIATYDDFSKSLLRYFMRRTFDTEVAADLAAETFAAAFRSRATFKPGGDPQSWLYGIASHQLSRYYRKGRVEGSARRRLEMNTPLLSDAGRDELRALIDDAELSSAVTTALSDLPAQQRDAVLLRIVDELGYDEIASRLGCSTQSARARVSRGLRALRSTLERSQEPSNQEYS